MLRMHLVVVFFCLDFGEIENMKKSRWILFAVVLSFFYGNQARAHFGMMIPSDSMIMQGESRTVNLMVSFSHPFERVGMPLEKPRVMAVFHDDKAQDLLGTLKEISFEEEKAWGLEYRINRPGIYQFYMEPMPYWEPAEDCFIIHHTRTVVAAFGDDENWDGEMGLKTEIVPLSKPFGLYAGNLFQGIVKLDGRPVPFARVEIEYDNREGNVQAPTDYMVTQTVKADQNGLFSYTVPGPGWWGFSALNTADYKLKMNGEEKDVELGAVLWVRFHEWKETTK